ncbi:MAG: RNA polymerase sigma factor [Solirubrobacteraceae bacterium]
MSADAREAVAAAFADEWGRIVAALIRRAGDWDLVEECAQEAFAEALRRWPEDGVPARPGAWLTTVAKNRAIDRLRRDRRRAELLEEAGALQIEVGSMDDDTDESGIEDDRLRLMFTCCHPALALEARVALTLRTLAGLTTAEIAHAFLVPEPTMAKRLVRAKAKIAGAGIPYRVPPAHLLPERTGGVLAVLYLLFNEGYTASGGPDLIRAKLCDEAIRLARALRGLMPDEPEAAGLLALMLFHHARRHARLDAAGDVVTLEDQDRELWNRDQIDEANAQLEAALRHRRAGPYQLQAAIAGCHTDASDAGATDWAQITSLYELLARIVPSPVVELNRAVAIAMSRGLDAGLEVVARLEASGRLEGYHLLYATRADLLRRQGRRDEASAAYRRALALGGSEVERRFLARRLDEVTGAG